MSTAESLAAAVRRELAHAGNPERAAGMRAYLRSALPCRGVRLPAIREMRAQDRPDATNREHRHGAPEGVPRREPRRDDFFIHKAIGWALREHAKIAPAWVVEFLAAREGRLSALSRREAVKHVEGVARDRTLQ